MSDRISVLKVRIGFLDKLGRHCLDLYRIYAGRASADEWLDKAAELFAKADVCRIELDRLQTACA